MPGYSTEILDEIRARLDITEVVGEFVVLKKTGANWKALCPFHSEKTPSFTVNPRRGVFHCFGCGAGGDAFGFVMRQDRVPFPEAVRLLARRAGVDLPGSRSGEVESGRQELLQVMETAAAFYARTLGMPAGERARKYLKERGIAADLAQGFRLGYAPDSWTSTLTFLKGEGFSEETLQRAGLAIARDGGGLYDRFRGRLMFAIKDIQGRVVAFGGRALGDEQPKYLNSPETELYSKGQMLYAMDLARDAMRTKQRALLVEGYIDCLMAHQHGFTETVAALGTSFTGAQLGLLRRHVSEVITFFDADAAGKKAAERAEELFEPTSEGTAWAVTRSGTFGDAGVLKLKVALLPAGHDPDTFLRTEGAAAFAERLAAARGLLSYVVDRAIADTPGASDPRGRATAFARVALILSKVTDSDEAIALSREAALKLGVDATQLWIEAQRLQGVRRRPTPEQTRPVAAPQAAPLVERDLVALLLHVDDARARLLPLIEAEDLTHPALRAVALALKQRPAASAESLMDDLEQDGERGLLAGLLMQDRDWTDAATLTTQFETRFEMKHRRRRIRDASRAIAVAEAAGTPGSPDLAAELRALQQEGEAAHGLMLGTGAERGHTQDR